MWLGLLGAPAAWTLQHVFGYGVTEAGCDPGSRHWGVPIDTWTAIATSVAGSLALLALVSSLLTFLAVRTSDLDADPPAGRIYFVSICGMVIAPLFLFIILLSGIGSLLLANCHQG
jgi:hypothetical protein